MNEGDCFETAEYFVSFASLSPGGTASATFHVRACKTGGSAQVTRPLR